MLGPGDAFQLSRVLLLQILVRSNASVFFFFVETPAFSCRVPLFPCALKKMSVYKGALPHERNGPDMGWMRVPVIILGLFVVAITQGAGRCCAFVRFYMCVPGDVRALHQLKRRQTLQRFIHYYVASGTKWLCRYCSFVLRTAEQRPAGKI